MKCDDLCDTRVIYMNPKLVITIGICEKCGTITKHSRNPNYITIYSDDTTELTENVWPKWEIK